MGFEPLFNGSFFLFIIHNSESIGQGFYLFAV
jgi:hypothetical protein